MEPSSSYSASLSPAASEDNYVTNVFSGLAQLWTLQATVLTCQGKTGVAIGTIREYTEVERGSHRGTKADIVTTHYSHLGNGQNQQNIKRTGHTSFLSTMISIIMNRWRNTVNPDFWKTQWHMRNISKCSLLLKLFLSTRQKIAAIACYKSVSKHKI